MWVGRSRGLSNSPQACARIVDCPSLVSSIPERRVQRAASRGTRRGWRRWTSDGESTNLSSMANATRRPAPRGSRQLTVDSWCGAVDGRAWRCRIAAAKYGREVQPQLNLPRTCNFAARTEHVPWCWAGHQVLSDLKYGNGTDTEHAVPTGDHFPPCLACTVVRIPVLRSHLNFLTKSMANNSRGGSNAGRTMKLSPCFTCTRLALLYHAPSKGNGRCPIRPLLGRYMVQNQPSHVREGRSLRNIDMHCSRPCTGSRIASNKSRRY